MSDISLSRSLGILLIGLFFLTGHIEAAGFPGSNLWFLKEPVFAGQKVTVGAVLSNPSKQTLSATVAFEDMGTIVATTSITLRPEASTLAEGTFIGTFGQRTFKARIVEMSEVRADGTRIAFSPAVKETASLSRFVDLDTDNDGIGDREDSDRDGDGIPDAEELRRGTDPLSGDTDKDGKSDAADSDPLKAESALAKPASVFTGFFETKAPLLASTTARSVSVVEAFRKNQLEQASGRLAASGYIASSTASGTVLGEFTATSSRALEAGNKKQFFEKAKFWINKSAVFLFRSAILFYIFIFILLLILLRVTYKISRRGD